ncbi:lamin tail domain-containing protein [Burkholderiaceae bacterium UC74_6]
MKKINFWMAGAAVTVLASVSGCGGGTDETGINSHQPPTLSATLPSSATAGAPVSITSITTTNTSAVVVDWGDGTSDAPTTIPTSLTHTYSPTATCVKAGTCTIDLSALGWGTPAEQKGAVLVSPAPTLAATIPATGTAGQVYTVTGVAAANGTALSVDWGDGVKETPAVSSTSLTHTYGAAGSYTVDIVLSGKNGTSAEQKGTITINAAAQPALLATLPTSGVTGLAVNVTGISTTNGTGLTVNWGDGVTETPAVSSTSLSHTYAATGTFAISITLAGPPSSTPASMSGNVTIGTPELFFSEYVEGSSNNKALEIYNPTSSAADLSLYSIKMWSRSASGVPVASTATQTLQLVGTLPAGKTLVIYNVSSSATLTSAVSASGTMTQADGTFASTNGHQVISFNGNDTVFLIKSGVTIDAIGATTDLASGATGPLLGWGAADASGTMLTVDHSLRRKAGIGRGTPSLDETWNPTVEWDIFPKDTFSGLGSR